MINDMKKFTAFILFSCACLFTSCNHTSDNIVANNLTDEKAKPDWEQGFVTSRQTEEKYLSVVDYIDLEHEKSDDLTFINAPINRTSGECFYTLQRCSTENRQENFIEIFSVEASKPKRLDIQLEDWDIMEGVVWSFDVLGSGKNESYVFTVGSNWTENEAGDLIPAACYLVHMDNVGAMISKMDIMSVLREQNGYEGGAVDVHEDKAGFLYLVPDNNRALYILNKQGDFVAQYICPEDEQNFICPPVKSEDEELIFPVKLGTEGCVRLLWLDKNKSMKELASLEETISGTWYAINDNQLYYLDNDTIIKWDVSTGYSEKIFNLSEAGASKGASSYMLLDSDQNIRLRIKTKTEDWVVTLSEKQLENTESVRLSIVNWENTFLKSCVADFSRKNPQFSVAYERAENNDTETYRDRILMEMVNGNGPDILYITNEDMEVLAAKGALADLEEFISADTLDKILPGVIEMGKYEGKLLGIAPDMHTRTMFTGNDTWNKEGWTLDDVLELAEEKGDLEGIFCSTIYSMGPAEVLYSLVGQDFNSEKSKFIDWNNNQSCFEEQNFMRVLEVIKKYANNGSIVNQNNAKKVLEGTYLAVDVYIMLPYIFYSTAAELGDAGYAVGYPTESGRSGSYITTNGVLAVNSKTENKEAISAFLESILKIQNQAKLEEALSVRLDITDATIVYNESVDKYYWVIGGENNVPLACRADGTTFTEEYKKFLQNCVPYKSNSDIYNIVEEEAMSYFEDNRDALSVVRVIDNRVQLYLNERK